MRHIVLPLLPLILMAPASAVPAAPQAAAKAKAPTATTAPAPNVISTGAKVKLTEFSMPERPTVFLFYTPSSTMERDFVASLQHDAGSAIGVSLVQLKSGSEPVAQQYQITETPTGLVYDRRDRLVARSSDATEIRKAVGQALHVMRIDWAQEGDPRLDAVRQMMGGQKQIPAIIRTMSLRPDVTAGFIQMSMRAQFQDGFLDRRTKELIGTYASALNQCPYCLGSHASNLLGQGQAPGDVDAIALLHPDAAKLSAKERALLAYVKVLTQEPSHVRDLNVARLREVGWTDEQIFEASFITSMFAFANRMASAYGLDYPSSGWLPPSMRPKDTPKSAPAAEPSQPPAAAG